MNKLSGMRRRSTALLVAAATGIAGAALAAGCSSGPDAAAVGDGAGIRSPQDGCDGAAEYIDSNGEQVICVYTEEPADPPEEPEEPPPDPDPWPWPPWPEDPEYPEEPPPPDPSGGGEPPVADVQVGDCAEILPQTAVRLAASSNGEVCRYTNGQEMPSRCLSISNGFCVIGHNGDCGHRPYYVHRSRMTKVASDNCLM